MSLEAEVAYLHLIDGVRQNEVPAGFAIHSAPRKAARGRDRDVLMIGLYLGPGAPADLADAITSAYFGTPGSVTAAARAAFSAASARLHDHNRYPPASGLIVGGLCLAVLRGVDLYAALSGVGQLLVVHPNAVERFPDSSAEPMQPFGAERDASVQYFHTVVAVADFALLTADAPAGWDIAALSHLNGAGIESAMARLTRSAGANASAMLARFAAESVAPQKTRPSILAAPLPSLTGHSEPAPILQPSDTPPLPSQPVAEVPARVPLAPSSPEPDTSSLAGIIARVRASASLGEPDDTQSVGATLAEGSHTGAVAPDRASDHAVVPERAVASDRDAPSVGATLAVAPAPKSETVHGEPDIVQIGDHVYEFEEEDSENGQDESAAPFLERARGWARAWVAALPLNRAGSVVKKGSESLGSSLGTSSNAVLRRVLPEGTLRPDTPMQVPDRVWLAIAILLPIIFAVVGGVVYIQQGRNEQYQQLWNEAKRDAGYAETILNPLDAKPHWQSALARMDQAEQLIPGDPDLAALRAKAQSAVDVVDNVQRLAFEPLVPGGFNNSAAITQIVVNGSEVYALDSKRQAVYRAVLTESDKFVPDRNFQCKLGVVGSVTIKRIVDIAWLNTPNTVGQPALMALDEDGDLMYCKTDGTQPAASTLIAPDAGWKTPQAIEVYADRLYVFDPGANDIWLYDRSGGVFSERPKSYFTTQVLDLSNALTFTITQGEVYILRADGRLTYCVRDLATLQTNCIPTTLYSDSRPGHASGEQLDDVALPVDLAYDPPPEPSLYLLDTASNGVYQLSLKLVLQKVYRSVAPLPGPITAVAIGPNKDLFVASGNNVYWGQR